MSMIPRDLPAGLEAYGRSPDFTPETMPERLRSAHSTKAGTWGLIHVLEGEILYQLESPHQGARRAAAGEQIVITPEVPHHVAFVEPGRFYVTFYRQAGTAA